MIRHHIVLSGDTFDVKNSLKDHGFMWHPTEKVWHRPWNDSAVDENIQVKLFVRTLKNVTVTFENATKFVSPGSSQTIRRFQHD